MDRRVLIISPWYGGNAGGVAIITESLVAALAYAGNKPVVLVASAPTTPWPARGLHQESVYGLTVYGDDVLVHGIVRRFTSVVRRAIALVLLMAIIARHRIRLAHFQFDVPEYTPIRRWLTWLGIPFVTTFHGSEVHQLEPKTEAADNLGKVVRASAMVTTVSHDLSVKLQRLVPEAQNRTAVIPNCVPVDAWNRLIHLDKVTREVDVLFIGSLRPVKGIDFLLRVLPLLVQRRPTLKAWIVGAGDMQNHIARSISVAGLDANVALLGAVSRQEMSGILQQARILVITSRAEGAPLVALEAQLAGVPVVATRVGGLPEVVAPMASALVPFGDSDGFANACERLLADEAHWDDCSIKARRWCQARFRPDIMAAQYSSLYRSVQASNVDR